MNFIKKLIFCGFVSLVIGAAVSASPVNSYMDSQLNMSSIEGGVEIIGEGVDEGGHYVIISTETECRKVYPKGSSSGGVFDH